MMETLTILLRHRDGSVAGHALVDQEDFERLDQHRWCLDNSTGYASRGSGSGSLVRMHREIMGLVPGDGLEVDHVSRDRLDNRRSNLRVVTRSEQMQNLPARTDVTSRHRGVSWYGQTGRWRAHCQIDRKQHHLGYFLREEEAAATVRAFRAERMPYSTEMEVSA